MNHKTKDSEKLTLESLLGDGCKSSISIIEEIDWMKDKTYLSSLALSVAVFYYAKELVKITKEAGLNSNPKGAGEDSSLKEGSKTVSIGS